MNTSAPNTASQDVAAALARLERWLVESAYPLWSTQGCDWQGGGFYERLSQTGEGLVEPRRARVQPRQVYSFAMGPAVGWNGDVERLSTHGFDYFHAKYCRPERLAITLVDADGSPKDTRVVLYDQAFALLAYATVAKLSGLNFDPREAAKELQRAIASQFRHAQGGFNAESPPVWPLQSNPHMHLFEACLAWLPLSEGPDWRILADELGELALARFIDAKSGALREFFGPEWQPAEGTAGRIVEPGHQYEWAWLLMRWDATDRRGGVKAALRMIDIAEEHGVRDGFAINSLLDDFSPHDAGARLWPQTERIKAAALAARRVGGERYWRMAAEAAQSLERYFATTVPGLWFDKRTASGEFVAEPSPASSFYHIVAAIAELKGLMAK